MQAYMGHNCIGLRMHVSMSAGVQARTTAGRGGGGVPKRARERACKDAQVRGCAGSFVYLFG